MVGGHLPRGSDPRTIEIDTARVMGRAQRHFAVIDIGSNSIRLVVYDDLSRAPFPRFNEKSFCALGAAIDADGMLSQAAIDRAVDGIERFHAIATAMSVATIHVIATEATRRAKNGAALIDAIRARTGLETRLLTGQEEATYAAHGVISGFFQPLGLVGDFGGGSLEIAELLGDRVGSRLVSMPIGAIPVRAMMAEGIDLAKARIDAILRDNLAGQPAEPIFYAIGGGWRALARVHIATLGRPISVVHAYDVATAEARALAKRIARMSPAEIALLPDAPSRRHDTLAAAAMVMSRVLKYLRPDRVVFSAIGLREGWLYAQLGEEERYRDPLLEGAQAFGLPAARVPEFSAALARWTEDLFPGETQIERRLRLAACALTDMSWRDHEKARPMESFRRLLQFPFIGLTHPERAFLAVTILSRYGGQLNEEVTRVTQDLLTPDELRRAEVLGRVLLLGHRFSASVPEILAQARIRIGEDAVRLEMLSGERAPDGDAVLARLRQLARVSGTAVAEVVEAAPEYASPRAD